MCALFHTGALFHYTHVHNLGYRTDQVPYKCSILDVAQELIQAEKSCGINEFNILQIRVLFHKPSHQN